MTDGGNVLFMPCQWPRPTTRAEVMAWPVPDTPPCEGTMALMTLQVPIDHEGGQRDRLVYKCDVCGGEDPA